MFIWRVIQITLGPSLDTWRTGGRHGAGHGTVWRDPVHGRISRGVRVRWHGHRPLLRRPRHRARRCLHPRTAHAESCLGQLYAAAAPALGLAIVQAEEEEQAIRVGGISTVGCDLAVEIGVILVQEYVVQDQLLISLLQLQMNSTQNSHPTYHCTAS
jgi:hypothetical protein